MGATSENFCLRWNDFETNVSGAFRELRAERDFFDVTLCCSDSEGRNLQAHKVILSACSSFFKNMLRQQSAQSNHPNPFIFLRGVSYSDLLSVLDFMYHGEVNVAQEDLNSFLSVAEELQIKGLTNKDGTSTGSEPSKKSSQKTSIPPAKRPRPASMSNAPKPSEEGPEEKPDIKSDPEAGPSSQAVTDYEGGEDQEAEEDYGNDEEFQESYYEDNGGDMLDQDMNQEDGDGTGKGSGNCSTALGVAVKADGGAACLMCGKSFTYLHNARTHYKEKHTQSDASYSCHICGKNFRIQRYLNCHLSARHGITQKMLRSSIM